MKATIRHYTLRAAAVVVLSVVVGCSTPDAATGNAERAANTGDSLVSAARGKCPGATQEIAAAESAAAAARAAAQKTSDLGTKLDDLEKEQTVWDKDADKANNAHSEAEKDAKQAEDAFNDSQRNWVKADEEYDGYRAQAVAAGFDTSDANLNGALDRMRAGAEVPLALANAARAKAKRDGFRAEHEAAKAKYGPEMKRTRAEADRKLADFKKAQKYRDQKRAELESARNAWRAAAADANEKTKASRAANAALSKACPDAQAAVYPEGMRLPGSQPPGLDVFGSTTSQHQEP